MAGAGAMALVDTGAEVTCISSAFLHRFWDVLGPYYTEECLLRLKAADGDALKLEGMVHAPIRLGSKAYRQAFFVVSNLNQDVLLGLDFMSMGHATISVADRTFAFGSGDCRETVYLEGASALVVGAIGTGEGTYLVRAAENKTLLPGQADHVQVSLDPPAPPGPYEFSSRHLVTDDGGVLCCDGHFLVEATADHAQGHQGQQADQPAPLQIRMLHDADDRTVFIKKGQVLSVALPPQSKSARGNAVFATMGEIVGTMELPWWDDISIPHCGRNAQVDYITNAFRGPTEGPEDGADTNPLTLAVSVEGTETIALVDQSTDTSYISAAFLQRCWGASDAAARAGGRVHVPITLGTETFQQAFFVRTSLRQDVVLGRNFMATVTSSHPPYLPGVRDPRVVDGRLTGTSLREEVFAQISTVAEQFSVTADMSESDMSEEDKRAFIAMVLRKVDAFTPHKEVPGLTNLEELHLNTGTHAPVAIPPRRIPYSQESMVYEKIQSWLKHGIIRASSSAWSAPVVVVMKGDKFRLAIDYRELNKRLTDDHMNYPLTLIDSCLDVMSGSQFFTTVDISGAFHQIPVAADSIAKTSFVSKWGQFEFLRAPFGIKSLPGLWSRLADKVLTGLKWQIAAVYMDDIIVFSRTGEDHVRDVELVLSRIIQAGLKIHVGKCKWARREVEYVGFIVGRDGVQPMPDKIASIRNFPLPKNLTDIRSFLSLASYYRRFIRDFSTQAGPLNQLLQKKAQWVWGEDQHHAFLALRDALASPPVLAYPDFSLPYELYTDASNFGLGAVLAQRDPNDPQDPPRVICFASRALHGTEKGYSPTHKEALAIRWAVEKFRPYLYGNKFKIFTDHKALEHIQKAKDTTGQLFRWSLFLQDFDFEIIFRPGRFNQAPDVLSRTPQEAEVMRISTDHRRPRLSRDAQVQAIRLECAEDDAVLVEDGGDDLQQEGRGLEDAGELLAPPTFVPQWEGKKRLWDFLAARSAAQRRQGGTGRTISMTSLDGRPTEMGTSNAVGEIYVGAISRGANSMEERAATHVNAAVDRDTPVGMARADDDGWSFSVDVLLEQKADPELASLRAFIESKGRTVPEGMTEKEQAAFRLAAKAYYIRPSDEVLCRLWRSSRSAARITVFHQVVVPTRLREVVLEAYHDHALGGHTGLGRLYERILRKYYWPSLLADATTHVKGCDLCNTRKNPPRRAVSEWAHRELAWKPFQRISMDFTPMGITSKSGNNSLLVAVDHLTRFVEAWPCSVETAEVVVKALTALTTRYGAPQEIISDNGSTLVAKTVKDLAKGLGAKKSTTAPYRHEANGLVERSIQSFQTMLKLAVEDGHEDEWDEHIDVARFAFNTNYHTSVGECPFFLLYGTDPNVPLDLILKADQPQYADLKDYTSRLAARLRKAWAAAREQNEATRQERYRRHKASAPYGFTKFETNARVYVFSPIKAKALSRKLTPAWSGPYRVLGQEIPGVYLVQPADGRTGQSIKVHVSRLKPYVTWAANYVARTRLHRDAFLDDPATELETPPPPPRGAQERQVRRREPTEAELRLEGKFLSDPKDSTSTWKVDKVAWDERSGEVVAFAVKVHVLRSGGYRLLHKKTEPMEVLAVDEAREWVAASSLLNKGLTPERGI